MNLKRLIAISAAIIFILLSLSCTQPSPPVASGTTSTTDTDGFPMRGTIKVVTGNVADIIATFGDEGLYASPSLVTIIFDDGTNIEFLLHEYLQFTTRHPVVIGHTYQFTLLKYESKIFWYFQSAKEVD